MPAKQGGKGKTSSPSRQASHKRGPARTEANRLKKITRHAHRMGLDKAQITAATLPDPFKGAPKTRRPGGDRESRAPLPMSGFGELPGNTLYPGFVIAAGVILEASPNSSRLHSAFTDARSVTPRAIYRRDPLGRLIPVQSATR